MKWIWISLLLSPAMVLADRNVELLASSCAACHGTNGHSKGNMPKLAGMHHDYFIEQMLAFKFGERDSPIMKHQASGYTEAEIRLMAEFFEWQN